MTPNENKLNAHPPTRRRLEAIGDPLERLSKASEIASQCQRKNDNMVKLRHERRVAIVALFRFHGINKAEIARRIGAKDRRVVDYAFGNKATKAPGVDLRDISDRLRTDGEYALQEAKAAHRMYMRYEAMGETAREIRRVLILELTTGRYGQRYRNATLAELIGSSPALVAQERTGSSNRTKPEQRAALRKKKEGAAPRKKGRTEAA